MMNEKKLKSIMEKCVQLAKDNFQKGQYPIAAIVADKEGNILATSSSSLREKNDPTNHPEVEVIRKSSELLESRFLSGYYLFTTLEPCPMCTAAAIWAKMQGIVYGAYQEDAIEFININLNRKFSWRQIHMKAKEIIGNGEPKLELYEGICREECKKLFV